MTADTPACLCLVALPGAQLSGDQGLGHCRVVHRHLCNVAIFVISNNAFLLYRVTGYIKNYPLL